MPDPTSRHPVSDGRMTVLRMWHGVPYVVRPTDDARMIARETGVKFRPWPEQVFYAPPVFSEPVEAAAVPTIAEIEAAVRRVIDERLWNCPGHLGGAGVPSNVSTSMGGAGRSVVR